jgi:hypothetical protein
MKDKRPKLLFKKFLYTKHDERLISEKAYVHLFFIQVLPLHCRYIAVHLFFIQVPRV